MDLNNKIDEAIGFIEQAHAELKKGNMTLLKDFETMVKNIQHEVLSKTITNPSLYVEKLETLATVLRNFEVDLRTLQIDVKYELMSLNKNQNAVKAYQTVNHSAAKSDDKKNEE